MKTKLIKPFKKTVWAVVSKVNPQRDAYFECYTTREEARKGCKEVNERIWVEACKVVKMELREAK